MSIFRKLLVFAAAIIIILYGVGFILPKSIQLERTLKINTSVDSVFQQVSILKNMSQWTPWKDYDPEMNVNYEGEDGNVGSVYKWSGNKDVGSGSMTITGLEKNRKVEIDLAFIEPYSSNSKIYFLFKGDSISSYVTWGYYEKTGVPKNVMTTIFGVKKMLITEFDKGLHNLKTRCEK